METKKKWFEVLEEKFNSLVLKYDFPEDMASEIYNFVMETARDQFKSGNKSGISWILREQAKKAVQNAPVAA
jgi:hypothetical protein